MAWKTLPVSMERVLQSLRDIPASHRMGGIEGVMVKTFRNLRGVRPGFDPTGVVTMQIALPEARYGREGKFALESMQMTSGFYEQLANRVRQLPGVTQVGLTERLPITDGDWCTGVTLEGNTPETARGWSAGSTTNRNCARTR